MKRGRIRWPLVAYDMLILLALDVLLLFCTGAASI